MKKKRKMPKTESRDKSETDKASGANSGVDLTDTEKKVGVHILGKRDMQRHFGTSEVDAGAFEYRDT